MENQLATFLGYSPLLLMSGPIALAILYKANQLRIQRAATESQDEHPTPALYAQIAGILLAITIIEVVVVIVDIGTLILIPVLLILSAIKFGFVIGYYMHLKFDETIFTWFFGGGLLLASCVIIALMVLFDQL